MPGDAEGVTLAPKRMTTTATSTDRGPNIKTAIAGEFFVAGEPSKRGWIATLTSKNTPGVDILANQDNRFRRTRRRDPHLRLPVWLAGRRRSHLRPGRLRRAGRSRR
jgi:hypothetical protein